MVEKFSNFQTAIGQDEKRNIHLLHQVHQHLLQIQNRDGSAKTKPANQIPKKGGIFGNKPKNLLNLKPY